MLVLLLTLPVCTLTSFVVVLTLFTIHWGVHHVEADSTYQAHGISVTAFILPYSTLDHLWGHQRSVWFSCELISASCSLTQSAEVRNIIHPNTSPSTLPQHQHTLTTLYHTVLTHHHHKSPQYPHIYYHTQHQNSLAHFIHTAFNLPSINPFTKRVYNIFAP